MGNKILSQIFAAGVLLLAVTLVAGILFAGPSQAGANEVLSKAPALTDKDGNLNDRVLADTASWFSDHFFGRQELISVHNYLTGILFGTSAADDVILGNDGWLYYTPTLADYTGTETMTTRQYGNILRNLTLMQEYCKNRGSQFSFMIAPNKNTLYPEHMPQYGAVADTSPAMLLQQGMALGEISYVDLLAAFGEQSERLYFAHDSHWNSKGAALGADCINDAFGVESSYFAGDFTQTQPHQGDLFDMLYPAFGDTETDFIYGDALEFTYLSKSTKPDSITLETQGAGDKSLLCYRDSFGNLLYPYLADSYGYARFSRSVTYDLTLDADCVLIELVERNLHYLYTYLPVMPAPQRDVVLSETFGTIKVEVKAAEGMQQVKGRLPETVDADSAVYVLCGDTVYEAFCLDGAFGAYVPTDQPVQAVAWYADGQLIACAVQ